ncbi:AarF/UbiB family protein [Methanosphaera sp. Vir-13MRS]|uniref:ABC1 kinase family protein n=1 Tax=Candidatus Methanosphaera massiliense TaxID=3017187 RepID=UPI0023806EB7|nr:AarF/UbiB family protein [Candidatus Methanosphaera massiliense]MDE4077670.1 AarF/UbiB family protein [Candidatus Methanosphaera massiliense]
MKLWDSKQDLSRMNEIIKVLAKYGFEGIAQHLTDKDIKYLPVEKFFPPQDTPIDMNTRIRLVLQDLGTTFIKLGQTLSTYPELIGFELADELSNLQESAPVDDFEKVKESIESEFSKPLEDIFDEFSEKPIASASIGQVHTAYLNNKQVAIKVQHPNIQNTVNSDIRIMKLIANTLNSNLAITKSYNLPGMVEVFEKDIRKELDYKFEAMNAVHLKELLKNDEVYVPKIYLEYCTDKVLVMEYLDGVSLNKVLEAPKGTYNNEKIALRGADSFIKQILVYGFYHADPHPGNIFVLNKDTVAFVDFGMMGHLDRDLRDDLAKLFILVSDGDAKLLTKQLYYMDIIKDRKYLKDIENEIIQILDKYYGVQFNDITGVLKDLAQSHILRKYNLVLPRDMMMVIRTITMVDDVGRSLDPGFNTTEILKPYAKRMLIDNLKPENLSRKTLEYYIDTQNLTKKIPNSLLNLLNVLEDGKLKLSLEYAELEKLMTMLSRMVNELVLAIITAALLVGSSLIMQTNKGILIMGYPFLGFVGFVFSAMLGIVLIIMIIRRGNY